MKKVAFCTLGCKVNQYETNAMEEKFINDGYEIVDFEKKADIYVINTCTVTNMSDKKSRQMLRKAKQLNNNSIVVAVGCYAQVSKEKLEEMEEVDLILGNNEKIDIVKYVEEFEKQKIIHIEDIIHQMEFLDFGTTTYMDKTRAVIKIQDGCDRFCSYCIIPYARGRVRSRKIENIICEIEALTAKGIKEVVLTGIHIASYGKDFKDNMTLIDLLERINSVKGLRRIRIGSLEPTIINEKFLERLSKLDKICHHFHLSLQSGCDETLKRMNRKYSTEEFKKVVNLLRKEYADVILTTDIIVGFPGETEEEFNKTYEFLKEISFYKMHVFKYSRRKGTKADSMENQILPQVQEERSKKILELSNDNQKMYNNKYIGKTVEVLFEEKEKECVKGHTKNYIMVSAKVDDIKKYNNQILKVEIFDNTVEELIGNVI